MIVSQAREIVEQMLAPFPLDDFLRSLGREWLSVKGEGSKLRAELLGGNPQRTILDAYRTHSNKLEWHGASPTLPPPQLGPIQSAEALHSLIKSFHSRDYTVVMTDVAALAPALQPFARSLEFILHQPVSASVFWSKAGARAIVHYDKRDNIVIQLSGEKRWFISTDQPGLQNNWKHIGEPLPQIERHKVVDVAPGDLIYIPRGTPHTVVSTTESLHLAILFSPLTLRDLMIAAIDYQSDLDRSWRETALADVETADFTTLSSSVAAAMTAALANCRNPDFLENSMRHRSARIIGDLPPLPPIAAPATLTVETCVAHAPLAISHLRDAHGVLDFSHPGSRMGIHAGAEPALRFIMSRPRFRVKEIPGLSDDVRIALVSRLMSSGFLQLGD
jgi:hypothetical protein